jgi:F-type H+-transporting ATPase subunit b
MNAMRIFSLLIVTLLSAAPVLAASEAHGSEGGASVFAGTVMQSVAALIVFAILFAVLAKFAWGPILKGLQDRENKIREDLEKAEAGAKQAAATLAEYEKRLADAQEEARKLIEKGRADAERLAAQLKEQAGNEVNAQRQRAATDIEAARKQAVADLYNQAATLSTQIAGKILKREIRPEDQQALVQQSLQELGRN